MDSADRFQIDAALFDFRVMLEHDEREGVQRPLADYLARFPGFEEHVAREYLVIVDARRAQASGRASSDAADGLPPILRLKRRLEHGRASRDRYEEREELGRGGMGVVHAVWDDDLQRTLARKTMLGLGQRLEAGFLEEAQITGQLDHPGIVPVHDLGIDAHGRAYFTMRLVKGQSLKEVFGHVHEKREGWTQVRALEVLLKVCDAMAYAHAKRVVHRDLKPANVMVGRFGEVYVMDWGLARISGKVDPHAARFAPDIASLTSIHTVRESEIASDPDSPLVTLDGLIAGTPPYMSPEQAEGRIDDLSARSDVYSVGAMLYQLLTGRIPYAPERGQTSPRIVLAQLLHGPPTPVHELAPKQPPELVAICERAMARDAERRYVDMREMAADLRAFLENRVVAAYQTGARAELSKWFVRNRKFALASSGAIALALAGVAGVAVSESRGRTKEERERARAVQYARRLEVSADAARLEQLESAADKLWPAVPARVPELESWRASLAEIEGRLPAYRERLSVLRAATAELTAAEQEADFVSNELSAEVATLARTIARARAALSEDSGLAPAQQERRRAYLAWAVPRLEQRERIARRRTTWRMLDPALQREQDELAAVVDRYEAMSDPDPRFGCIENVRERISAARSLRQRTIDAHRGAWDRALASIADPAVCPAYRGLEIVEQDGLVPVGQDRESGLWEFAVASTGEIPSRAPDGRLVIADESALVLVLVPSGRFRQGAQREDPNAPNYDPNAAGDERPTREVDIEPFFLAKHEMTQGQWSRAFDERPSLFGYFELLADAAVAATDRHPVERVSWETSHSRLLRLGLDLPSEAQWEYACRAGTSTVYWTGDDPSTLVGAGNWLDKTRLTKFGNQVAEDALDDGVHQTAPACSLRPNAFGLHEMLGNVSEWCRTLYAPYEAKSNSSSSDALELGLTERVLRGGSFASPVSLLRCSRRAGLDPTMRPETLGVRPSRALEGRVE